MTSQELELVGAIYALYGYECLHWLKENETAFTRRSAGGWRAWAPESNAFTLLGRRPCVVALLPFRAGLVRDVSSEGAVSSDAERRLRKVDAGMAGSSWLLIAATVEGLAFMAAVPAVIAAGALRLVWPLLVGAVAVFHIATVVLFARAVRRWEKNPRERRKHLLAACVNPLAAVRCGDVLAGRIFASASRFSPKC